MCKIKDTYRSSSKLISRSVTTRTFTRLTISGCFASLCCKVCCFARVPSRCSLPNTRMPPRRRASCHYTEAHINEKCDDQGKCILQTIAGGVWSSGAGGHLDMYTRDFQDAGHVVGSKLIYYRFVSQKFKAKAVKYGLIVWQENCGILTF